jgi:hypothetical protein
MNNRLIFVGRDCPDVTGWNWDFQGIFDNATMALAAMKDITYFASWVDLNVALPEDSAEFVEIPLFELELLSRDEKAD